MDGANGLYEDHDGISIDLRLCLCLSMTHISLFRAIVGVELVKMVYEIMR